MESTREPAKQKRRTNRLAGSASSFAVEEKTISALVGARARFHRFVAVRIGDAALADDVLRKGLRRALEERASLRRGESAVAWFSRILRNAIADHGRKRGVESRRPGKFLAEMQARDGDGAMPSAVWEGAVGACFRGFLPLLNPRYADVIRRVDLRGEPKQEVARCEGFGVAP